MRLVATILAFALFAPAEERTVTLVNAAQERDLQELSTLLHTIAGVETPIVDSKQLLMRLDGTSAQLDAAAWLVHQFDQPAGWRPSEQEIRNSSAREHLLQAGEPARRVRVYYLPETTTRIEMQQRIPVVRVVLDIQRAFAYFPQRVMVVCGSESELDRVEWLLAALQARTPSEPYALPDGRPFDVLRVFPLPDDSTLQQRQEMLTTMRSAPLYLMKVFVSNAPPAIAVRGTAAQLDQAEKLIPPIRSAAQ